MLPQLKTYIENNIEYLDQKNYYFFDYDHRDLLSHDATETVLKNGLDQ